MSKDTAELVWNLALAIRRLMVLLGDGDSSARRFALATLEKADNLLER